MGFEQPGISEGVPGHGGGLEIDDLWSPLQPKPFYDMRVNSRKFYVCQGLKQTPFSFSD